MNMQKVAAEYTRTGVLRKDIEKMATDLDEPIKKLQAQAQPLTQPASNAQDAEDKQKKLVSLRRQIEDMTNDAKKKLTEKTAQGEQDIYKDIEAAVYALSRDRGIDLVLYYNDVTDAAMKYNAQALTKRISTSGMPIYTGQGTEITDQVVRVLNFNWERNHPTPKASGQ
jgi:Skp family chaperone for outer membrane proteins